MKIEIHYEDDATYAAFVLSADGRMKRQFAFVAGRQIPVMLETSTEPLRLRFERVA